MKRVLLFSCTMILLLCPFNAFANIQTIAEIQGEKQISAFNNQEVIVRGIVTARVRNGFFVQTPDDQIDNNPKTSEAIFVFTGKEPNEAATVGNLVEVTGLVSEFVPKAEPVTFPLTEIRAAKSSDEIKIVSKNNQLPKPFVLTAVDFTGANANAKHEALERYEAMRVKATSLTTVAPTGGRVDEKNATATSDGVFYAVLTGTPRPFRKPGAEFFETANLDLPLSVPVFDGNPQLLRVDSDAQLGAAALDVAANATIKNLVGVLDYSYRTWTILPDPNGSPVILNNAKATAVAAAKPSEFAIASFNLERFFDDADDPTVDEPVLTKNAWNNRLQKASLVIHEYLKTPDVLALVEVENLPTLQKLADKINSAAAANGKNDFKYAAFLLEGNDDNGIDTGFLINTRRVQVSKVEQIGKSEFYKRQSDDRKVPLFDRPPLVLNAVVKDNDKTFAFTVIANHLKSLRGVFDRDGETRRKKQLQAEFVARAVQKFQIAKPSEPLILIGDFNAFEFSDGLVDVIGTIKGKPAPADQVLHRTEDLVDPDLTDLVEVIPPAERYSFVYAGNAQALDHVLLNQAAKKHAARFGFARLGADFPETLRNNPTRPERLSDHDAAVVYLSLDAIQPAVKP